MRSKSKSGRDSRFEPEKSRRSFLKSSTGLLAGGAAAEVLPAAARAQAAGGAEGDADLARLQTRRRILLKGGVVLSLDRQVGDFVHGDVLIEGGKIREIGPDIAASDEETAVVDAANRIIVPGFVDTQSHSYQGLLRNILTTGIVDPDYNRDVQSILTPAYEPADAYAGVLVTALGFIDMGTTTIVDLSQVSHTPEHTDACIHALRDSGIRAVFAFHRGTGPAAQYPQDLARLRRTYFSSTDQLLTLALSATSEVKMFAFAREHDVPAVLNFANRAVVPKFLEIARAGLLRPGDEYLHCTGADDEAWRVIRDSGGHVSLANQTEMAMGQGPPAIQPALDHGVRPSLSSDHPATMNQDVFSIMRATFTLQHLRLFQRAWGGEQNLPARLTPREVLEFVTIEGARCANLEAKTGSLTPGKEADVVMLRADRLSVWPLNNAPGVIVNMMNPSHVDAVFIAGKVKKWRGNLVGIDVPSVLRRVENARDAVVRRAGFRINVLG
ncbi:MAG TPA: amidohydrolase family protein [Xanthobacteraceae bacterium]|jgi:cytosine/adenosine deaminase-related metal-dependent hydrolase